MRDNISYHSFIQLTFIIILLNQFTRNYRKVRNVSYKKSPGILSKLVVTNAAVKMRTCKDLSRQRASAAAR